MLICIGVLSSVQSQEILANNKSTESPQTEDYYSDVDLEFETNIRSVENWMTTAIFAISLIGSVAFVIILIHLRSRKKSGLMYLMWTNNIDKN